jgi:hypothetical protein
MATAKSSSKSAKSGSSSKSFIVQIESGQQQVRDIHDRRLEQERDLEKFGNEQDRGL